MEARARFLTLWQRREKHDRFQLYNAALAALAELLTAQERSAAMLLPVNALSATREELSKSTTCEPTCNDTAPKPVGQLIEMIAPLIYGEERIGTATRIIMALAPYLRKP